MNNQNRNNRMYNSPQQAYNSNPILETLNQGTTQSNNGLMGMIKAYRNARNPQQMLNSIIQQNPQMQAVMDLVNQHGGNAQNLFYALARQRGIDPDAFLKNIFG